MERERESGGKHEPSLSETASRREEAKALYDRRRRRASVCIREREEGKEEEEVKVKEEENFSLLSLTHTLNSAEAGVKEDE